MKELTVMLNNVSDTYYDFVIAVLNYAEKSNHRKHIVMDYIKNNPEASSSDIIGYISDQPDFYDDSVCPKVV